jgi:hypothetical protein
VKDCATPLLFSLMLEKLVRSTLSEVGGVIVCFLDAVSLSEVVVVIPTFRGLDGIIFGEWFAILKKNLSGEFLFGLAFICSAYEKW